MVHGMPLAQSTTHRGCSALNSDPPSQNLLGPGERGGGSVAPSGVVPGTPHTYLKMIPSSR